MSAFSFSSSSSSAATFSLSLQSSSFSSMPSTSFSPFSRGSSTPSSSLAAPSSLPAPSFSLFGPSLSSSSSSAAPSSPFPGQVVVGWNHSDREKKGSLLGATSAPSTGFTSTTTSPPFSRGSSNLSSSLAAPSSPFSSSLFPSSSAAPSFSFFGPSLSSSSSSAAPSPPFPGQVVVDWSHSDRKKKGSLLGATSAPSTGFTSTTTSPPLSRGSSNLSSSLAATSSFGSSLFSSSSAAPSFSFVGPSLSSSSSSAAPSSPFPGQVVIGWSHSDREKKGSLLGANFAPSTGFTSTTTSPPFSRGSSNLSSSLAATSSFGSSLFSSSSAAPSFSLFGPSLSSSSSSAAPSSPFSGRIVVDRSHSYWKKEGSLLGATSAPSTGFTSTTTSASAASSGATTSFPSFSLSTKESAATTGSSTAPVFAIWWERYGYDCPALQKFAIRVLSLTCSATGCERNWSVFDQIHSKRRNRLEQKRLNALVFVKYNLQLEQRQITRRKKDNLDPICLSDLESDDEWITELEEPSLPQSEWTEVNECFTTQDLEATVRQPKKRRDFSMSASAGLSTEGAARISFFNSSATTQPLSLVSAPSSGGSTLTTSSTVSATQSSAPKLPSEITGKTVEEVTEALARAGLGSSNLIVGIDFTKSNEWTGKWSFNNRSLHYIGDCQNPYEQAISIIGRTLSAFDEDNLIPCFGFGDAFTRDKDVFSLYPDGRFCYGFEEALERYREIAPHLSLAGPTSFAPVIEMAITIAEQSGGQYHVLVIVTDGQVTRSVDTSPGHLSPQEKDTMDAIVRASEYPLSIILVGVGDGPWDTMKEFDDNIPARAFDNFQFVNFTEIMLKSVPLSKKETEFALAALMGIPSQYKATIELKILGRRTGNSLERVSLPPHLNDGVPSSFSSFKPSQPTYCSSYDTPVGSSPPVSSAINNQDCPICLTNPKDMAFGCGHQTCCECAPSLESCPICRSPIQIRIKLY